MMIELQQMMRMGDGSRRFMEEEERLDIVDLSGLSMDSLPKPSLNLTTICKLNLSNNNLQGDGGRGLPFVKLQKYPPRNDVVWERVFITQTGWPYGPASHFIFSVLSLTERTKMFSAFSLASLIGGKPVTGRQPCAAVNITAGHRIRSESERIYKNTFGVSKVPARSGGRGFLGSGGGFYSHHRCGRRTGPKRGSRWSSGVFIWNVAAAEAAKECRQRSNGCDDEAAGIMRSGPDSSIAELANFICAAHMTKDADALLPRKLEKKLLNEDDHAFHLLITMIGSVQPDQITQRTLPEDAIEHIILPNSMIGSVQPDQITQRTLPENAIEHIILPNSMIGSVQPDQITQRTLPENAIEHIILPNSMIGSVQPDQITQRTLPEDAIEHIILPNSMIGSVQPDQITHRILPEDAIEHIILPNSMIGSVQPDQITHRTLPEDAIEHIIFPNSMIGSVQPDQITQRTLPEDAIEHIILPNSMIGSVQPDQITHRTLSEDAIEHIILPVNVWTRIS
ncbi:hypothetical protein F3Y22_tig00112542pilonHSYRG00003 [Hibiscus syriacus]|uniref:Uncharacterized protein n=1 Tax=Hibiscus syriacus TaxID=106335 RepID=A0A6A2Y7P7_HIBSY|nr:hypothetical protein F3Y22_tig00112542pilonHSYRG00003 [Hibiscus syriacus]